MQEISLNFPITRAVIYPQSAGITRAAEVSFTEGLNRLIIPGLPQQLTAESVRIEPDPAAGLKILEVSTEEKLLDPYDENLYRQTEKQVRELQHKSSKLAATYKIYTNEFLLFYDKETLSASLTPGAPRPLAAENWEAFLGFVEEKLEDNRNRTRELLFDWLKVQRELKAARANLQKYKTYAQKREHRIVTLLKAPGAVTGRIRIHYIQPGVSWHPAYRIRARLAEKELEFALYAMLSQNTGEDWKDIQLELSTAIPMQGCDIPPVLAKMIQEKSAEVVLHTTGATDAFKLEEEKFGEDDRKADKALFLKEARIMRSRSAGKTKRKMMGGMPEREILSCEEEAAPMPIEKPPSAPPPPSPQTSKKDAKFRGAEASTAFFPHMLKQTQTTLNQGLSLQRLPANYRDLFDFMCLDYAPESVVPLTPPGRVNKHFANGTSLLTSLGGYDYRYKAASARNTIPSTGLPVQLNIETRQLPMETEYVTIPYHREAVFLKARFSNSGASPFPAGPAQVFVENTFLANINLETLARNQGTAISLGIEKDISVKRRETSQRKTSGLIGKEIHTEFKIEIELTSYKPEPVTLLVYDRLPVSRQKKELTVLDPVYAPQPWEIREKSILIWKLTCEKGKKTIIKFSYTIKQPENFQLELQEGQYKFQH